jgi:phytoene synthase
MSAQSAVEEAYARCEAITREQAANFYYGIRLLSGERRRAMCAVYAFARRIDDIGDGPLPTEQKLALLDEEERALEPLAAATGILGIEGDPVVLALADARTRFPLPVDALSELIEGVRMDVRGTSYETFEELLPYCRRVAGTIGRLCLAIFGLRDAPGADRGARAEVLADDLGVALQLTNILRDVREDAENGRIYLPAQDLAAHALPRGDPAVLAAVIRAGAAGEEPVRAELGALVSFEAERAREWFDRGLELADMLDRRSAACLLAMAGIYRRLLERIDAEPDAVLRGRVSLPAREKALVAVRGMLGVAA